MNEPDYSGINTFFESPQCELEDVDANIDIAAIGAPFDGGATNKPGARYGPEGLRKATSRISRELNASNKMYNFSTGRTVSYSSLNVCDCGDITLVPNDIEQTLHRVRDSVEQINPSTLPILLGGDHSLTYPAFYGRASTMGEDIGVIQLDAHTDTWGTDELYGEYYHGSPMSHIADSEYGSYSTHSVVGVRGHTDEEFTRLVDEQGLYAETTSDVCTRGIKECIEAAMESLLNGSDRVYLTVDIDVVDPAFAPGTGTPSPGGIDSNAFLKAADILGEYDEICAVDLMEVAPRLDPTDITSLLGATFLSRFIQAYFYDSVS